MKLYRTPIFSIENFFSLSKILSLCYKINMTRNVPKEWPSTLPYASCPYSTQMKMSLIRKFYFPFQETSSCSTLDRGVLKECVKIDICPPGHPLAEKEAPLGHANRRLIATRKIFANTILGEYAGDTSVYQNLSEFYAKVKKPSKYAWLIDLPYFPLFIDAEKGGNELALVNHFKGIAERPNLEPHFVKINGLLHFCYITSQDIEEKEELLIDYGMAIGK